MPRFVGFELAQGGQLAVNASAVIWARPASDLEKADGRYFRFHVAGHCQILLTPDFEESNDFRVVGTFEEVLAKLEGR